MGDGGWTHEWLNASDSLNEGDLQPLLNLLIKGEKPPEVLREKIESLLDDHRYGWHIRQKTAGRPKGSTKGFGINASIDLYHIKEYVKSKKLLKIVEFELIVQESFYERKEVSLSYVRAAIKRGQDTVKALKDNGFNYTAPTVEELLNKYPRLFTEIEK